MISRNALLWGTERLRSTGTVSASLDAEILLAHTLKITKEKLFAHQEHLLTRLQLTTYRRLIKRRAKHEPIAYILGRKEFYGLDFLVDRRVLIPRPETELMVEEVLKLLTPPSLPLSGEGLFKILPLIRGRQRGLEGINIIDIGTGSGCIIISLAKLLTTRYSLPTRFLATDASCSALILANRNARLHGVGRKITFLHGNLLWPFLNTRNFANSQFRNFIITANLPYLPTSEWRQTPPEVRRYEPREALDGGSDGLKYCRELFTQLKKFCSMLRASCLVLCEICPHQSNAIKTIARSSFPACQVKIKKDLTGLNRLAIINIKHPH